MALIHMNYYSTSLQKQSAMNIVLPDGDGPFRVVYQLHGLSDDYTVWLRRTSIERYADAHHLLIVMPDGARSFYSDMTACFAPYERHLLETVQLVDRTFRTIAAPEGRAIGGLSMGGYGAMKFGLKYPDLFGSIASHSGALDLASRFTSELSWELSTIFGERLAPEHDTFALAARPGPHPAIYFDCGVDDFLLEDNRRFRAHLERLRLTHTYREFPGAHSWDYWDAHVPEALAFHVESLNAAQPVA
jgi:putative tributyrin esterase